MFRISTTGEISFSCRTGSILRALRIILQVNNELAQNIGEGFSENLETLVELRGLRSNEFDEDLSSAIKHIRCG